jgi:tetratricopeptide (TPR) repeat protein
MTGTGQKENTTAATVPSTGTTPGWFSGQVILQLSVILLTGIIAYCNSLNGPFHFDDLGITDKYYLWPRAFTPSARQFADLTFVLNHLLNGQQVFGFHLVNMIVHLAAALALYGLASSVLSALSLTHSRPAEPDTSRTEFLRRFIPFAAALIFVCHPIQTQAVTYIVQRYTTMAALFYFGSVMVFIRARTATLEKRSLVHIWTLTFLTLLLGIIAMRCKEIAYTLPLMLIVAEVFLFRGLLLKNRVFVGFMAVLFLAPLVQRLAQHGLGGLDDLFYSIQHSTKEELTYSRSDYLFTQFRVIVSYLRLLILPINQNLDYDIPLQRSFYALPVLASLAVHISLLLVSALLFIRSRRLFLSGDRHTGICLRLISFGIVWFYLSLMIESSFIPILDVMFEHRLYLPSGGAFLATASMAAILAASRVSRRRAAWIALAAVCCVLTVATIQRNRLWNNDLLLWEDTARKSPNKPRVLANLAASYIREQMPEKALPPLLRSIELAPGLTDSLSFLGYVLDLIGTYGGRYDNGKRFIIGSRTVDMRYYNSWFANTRNNLGLAYEHAGNLEMALRHYETAVALSPGFDLAWYNIYLTAARLQDRQRATAALETLKKLNPELARKAILQSGSQP